MNYRYEIKYGILSKSGIGHLIEGGIYPSLEDAQSYVKFYRNLFNKSSRERSRWSNWIEDASYGTHLEILIEEVIYDHNGNELNRDVVNLV